MISFEEFARLASDANVIPLTRTLYADMHTPVSTYLSLRDGSSASFLFESAEPHERVGRYSFVGVNPLLTIRARGEHLDVRGDGNVRARNIFDAAEEILGRYRFAHGSGIEGFAGGLVGSIGYANVAHLERIPIAAPGRDDEDDAILGLYTSIVRFDHRQQILTIIHNVLIDPSRPLRGQYEDGRKAVDTLELRLRRTAVATTNFRCDPLSMKEETGKEDFCRAVVDAQRHIVEGDIFQVVLSRRISGTFTGDPFAMYRALRIINPSPYLFFVDFGETRLIGSSPEVLLRVQNRVAEVFPIAGTRRRGATPEEDLMLERDLLSDEKELAEHVMLVDLGRNDIGRVAAYATVEVPVLKRVERYSHVMHIVSEVRGRLRDELSALDALKACFPAGTVSGAPKVRAMEIINSLEGARRGTYAGAVGYIGFDGSLDTCIAIRTVVTHRERLSIQAGAGIVADSVPETEYQETVNKSRALLEAVRMAGEGRSNLPFGMGPGGERT